MYYQNIQGWFDFQDIYEEMIVAFDSAIFVEVGVWLGKSACFMAERIQEYQKNIKFYAVDTWKGSNETGHQDYITKIGGHTSLLQEFLQNMYTAKVSNLVHPLVMSSVDAASFFKNQSIDFVFIDGDHYYESVKADIEAWLPKVKTGGFIGGHDYMIGHPPSDGLVRAVNEHFGKVQIRGSSWLYELPRI